MKVIIALILSALALGGCAPLVVGGIAYGAYKIGQHSPRHITVCDARNKHDCRVVHVD